MELQLEATQRITNKKFDTVYLGGGTPTCIDEQQLQCLLEILLPYTQDCCEYTVEVNPETITQKKVQLLRQYGVNRVSMGVQSVNEELLKVMTRAHTKNDIEQALIWFKEAGIKNISLDCMYSLPQQTMEQLEETVQQIVKWDVPHISIYSLTIEPHSQFYKDGKNALDEEIEADMYEWIISYLEKSGYYRYEISNFAKKGYESKHNKHYWKYHDFVAISLGASGKENGKRYDNVTNFQDYFNHCYIKQEIPLQLQDQQFETLMMGLRLDEGINIDLFNQRFQCHFMSEYAGAVQEALKRGWIFFENGYLKCTKDGLNLCNSVIELFMQ